MVHEGLRPTQAVPIVGETRSSGEAQRPSEEERDRRSQAWLIGPPTGALHRAARLPIKVWTPI